MIFASCSVRLGPLIGPWGTSEAWGLDAGRGIYSLREKQAAWILR
jgi:hypothetical protein